MDFEGFVWLLDAGGGWFGRDRWIETPLFIRSTYVEFMQSHQSVLQFQNADYIVHSSQGSGVEHQETHRILIKLAVRKLEDLRKSYIYHTATKTTQIEFYAESDDVYQEILRSFQSKTTTTKDLSVVINDAFQALEMAQKASGRGESTKAVKLYNDAQMGFTTAAKGVVDSKRKELFKTQCEDIQKNIDEIQKSCLDLLEFQVESNNDARTMEERMHELDDFAQQRAAHRAQDEKSTDPKDLAVRLSALKNERRKASSIQALTSRLQKLRGHESEQDGDRESSSEVNRIIQQAQDEVTLGLAQEENMSDLDRDSSSSDEQSDEKSSFNC